MSGQWMTRKEFLVILYIGEKNNEKRNETFGQHVLATDQIQQAENYWTKLDSIENPFE